MTTSFLLGDGYLTPDTGAKAATLDAMVARGDASPDLGWWAADLDPDGSLHPYHQVHTFGDRFVAVTTLPLLSLARPLYAVGGHQAALLVPIAGGLLAALAAGALARRLGADRTGRATAIWVTGAAGPVTVYALSLWEHTLGLALMAWGVVWALDAVRRPGSPAHNLACGAAFGAAATMRQEAMVYGAVAGAVVAGVPLVRRRLRKSAVAGLAFAAGVAVTTVAALALEVALLGSPLRSGRSADALSDAGSNLAVRVEAALATFAAPVSSGGAVGLLLAVGVLVGLPLLVRVVHRGGDVRGPVAAMAALVALSAMFQIQVGPTFVPGLIAASPLAGAGLALALERSSWRHEPVAIALVMALCPLPLVWAVQYATEGAWPQWGGRYVLVSGFVLAVVAVSRLGSAGHHLRRWLIGANVAVAVLGLATLVQRSHEYERLAAELVSRPEPVLVFHDGFLVQEAGTAGRELRWMGATGEVERHEAARALGALGVTTFGYVGPRSVADASFPGYELVDESEVGDEGGRRELVRTYRATAVNPVSGVG